MKIKKTIVASALLLAVAIPYASLAAGYDKFELTLTNVPTNEQQCISYQKQLTFDPPSMRFWKGKNCEGEFITYNMPKDPIDLCLQQPPLKVGSEWIKASDMLDGLELAVKKTTTKPQDYNCMKLLFSVKVKGSKFETHQSMPIRISVVKKNKFFSLKFFNSKYTINFPSLNP